MIYSSLRQFVWDDTPPVQNLPNVANWMPSADTSIKQLEDESDRINFTIATAYVEAHHVILAKLMPIDPLKTARGCQRPA